MRCFKTKLFTRFAQRKRIADSSLRGAACRAQQGLVDANLGGGLIKQRVARPGQGRRGGFRVLLVFDPGVLAVFLYGFAKNDRDDIEDDELAVVREVAASWLAADAGQIKRAVDAGLLIEVEDDD